MDYSFVPMNQEYATSIVDTWKYPNEYAIYDYVNEAEHMLDDEGWGRGIFAVLDQDGDLVGELSIEFYDKDGACTEYSDFDNEAITNERELWIGFGLRPDIVGKGLGEGFVAACVEYAVKHHHYRGEYIRLGVAKFNQRAIKTYERVGFQEFDQVVDEISGKTFACAYMRMPL